MPRSTYTTFARDASGKCCDVPGLARADRFGAQGERVPTPGMLKLENADTGEPAPNLSERFQGRHESLRIMIEQRYFEAIVVRKRVCEGQVGREPEQPLPSGVGLGVVQPAGR